MGLFNRIALAAVFAAASTVGALAADAITLPIGEQVAELPVADEGFDWSGFYAGVYGAAQFGAASDARYGGGLALGVNAEFDFFLVGGEIAVHGLLGEDDPAAYAQVLARGGVLVTDDVAVYAAAGYGTGVGDSAVDQDVLLGGGVEFAVADSLSLRAQYLHGFPITGDDAAEQVTLGANFHF